MPKAADTQKTNAMKMHFFPTLALLFFSVNIFAQVTGYQPFYATAQQAGQKETLIVLRKWQQSGVEKMLVVHPASLQTETLPANTLKLQPGDWSSIRAGLTSTPYLKALNNAYETHLRQLQVADAAASRLKQGIDLTIDLCPASGSFNRAFIQTIIDKANPEEKPVKLTVAVTGMWIIKHPDDLSWLKQQQKSNILDITWVNHSFHHHLTADQAVPQNFTLDASHENDVLQTEKLMLANGITPSVFFSIPGEVNSPEPFTGAAEYGLIGISHDGLLTRGGLPNNSSLLISANGNERLNGTLFLETLANNRSQIIPWQWIYFDLSKGGSPPRK